MLNKEFHGIAVAAKEPVRSALSLLGELATMTDDDLLLQRIDIAIQSAHTLESAIAIVQLRAGQVAREEDEQRDALIRSLEASIESMRGVSA